MTNERTTDDVLDILEHPVVLIILMLALFTVGAFGAANWSDWLWT